jgi:hypothetical protein
MVTRHGDLIGAIEAGDGDGAEAEASALTADLVRRLRSYLEENLTTKVRTGGADVQQAPGSDWSDPSVGRQPGRPKSKQGEK